MTFKKEDARFTKITLEGEWFEYILGNGLYLSGSNNTFNLSTYDLYSTSKSTSANNPPFRGTPVLEYKVLNNFVLEFDLPENIIPGFYDIVYCNPAGYIIASKTKFFKPFQII